MSYDLHGTWDGKTGQHSALYQSAADNSQLNVDSCVNAWLNAGASPSKLVVGIGLYGRTFTLSDVNRNGIGAPISGAGRPGESTEEGGILSYQEVGANSQ